MEKKWIYRVTCVDPNGSTTNFEYDADQVMWSNSVDGDFIIRLKSGAEYAFNRRYLLAWRYIEV